MQTATNNDQRTCSTAALAASALPAARSPSPRSTAFRAISNGASSTDAARQLGDLKS
jgi:hypothetical protein